MAFKSPERRMQSLAKDLAGLGMPGGFGQKMVLQGMRRAVLNELREEFQASRGPEDAWKPTVRGKPALVSKKLPQAFRVLIEPGKLIALGKSKRDLLEAHQLGHTFPPRRVAANQQYLSFNAKGKLVKEKRVLTKSKKSFSNLWGLLGRKTMFRKGAYQRFSGAHTVGQRRLVARPIVPTGTVLPPRWDAAVAAGAEEGLQRWIKRVAR